jgi:hypothetical protein
MKKTFLKLREFLYFPIECAVERCPGLILLHATLLSLGLIQIYPNLNATHTIAIALAVLCLFLFWIKSAPKKLPPAMQVFSGLGYTFALLIFPYLSDTIEIHTFFVVLISIAVGQILFFLTIMILSVFKLPQPLLLPETASILINTSCKTAYDILIYRETQNFWKPYIEKISALDDNGKKNFFKVYLKTGSSYIIEIVNVVPEKCFTLKAEQKEIGVSAETTFTFTPNPQGLYIKVQTLTKARDISSILMYLLANAEKEQLLEAKAFLEKNHPIDQNIEKDGSV